MQKTYASQKNQLPALNGHAVMYVNVNETCAYISDGSMNQLFDCFYFIPSRLRNSAKSSCAICMERRAAA